MTVPTKKKRIKPIRAFFFYIIQLYDILMMKVNAT